MSHEFLIDDSASKYLEQIYDQCATRYSMLDYIPAVYWVINSGLADDSGKYTLSNKSRYFVVVVKKIDSLNDEKMTIAPNKDVVVRLDPQLNECTKLHVSLSNDEIVIVGKN